jgi:hypothetical protein
MVTTVGSEAKPTKTVKRMYLLKWQVRNLLSRTSANISKDCRDKLTGKGIENQWIQKIGVYGLDGTKYAHCGLELEIDWATHYIRVLVFGDEVTIDRTVFTDDLAPEVGNAIEVFNQAFNAEILTTKCRVSYVPGVDVAKVQRELGLQDAPPLTWAGKVEKQSFGITEMPELKVRLLIAESADPVPQEPQPSPEKDECKDKGLYDRIKDALG